MSPSSLPEVVANSLSRHAAAEQTVAVALSGGVDSMVLLDIMAALKASAHFPRLELCAVHINHGISSNAGDWAEFCRVQCAQRDIPLTVAVVNVSRDTGLGLEAAARDARYAALRAHPAAFILSAQHQDDQAETVLHQMLRGTGLNGLAGMGECRELRAGQLLLRPILNARRADIEAYAAERGLQWIDDESNQDTRYMRNFIRQDLLPMVATRFPHYAESLARAARHAAESAELLEALAALDLDCKEQDKHSDVRADILDALPLPRQVNALYHWLRWQNVAPPSRRQLEDWATQLFRPATEGKPQQAGGHAYLIRRSRNRLILNLA